MFNRKYIFKGSIFHCYVSLPECKPHLFLFFFWGGGGAVWSHKKYIRDLHQTDHLLKKWGTSRNSLGFWKRWKKNAPAGTSKRWPVTEANNVTSVIPRKWCVSKYWSSESLFLRRFFFPSLKLRYPLKMDGWNTRQFPFGSFFHYTYKCFKKGPLKHAYIMFLPFRFKVWCQIKKNMFAYNFLSQDSIVSWTSKIDVFNPLNSLHIIPQHRQQDPIPIESHRIHGTGIFTYVHLLDGVKIKQYLKPPPSLVDCYIW